MPGLDGFTVAEQLRADPELAEIPIIVHDRQGPVARRPGDGSRGTVEHLVPKGSLPHAELARLVDRASRRPPPAAGDAMSQDAQILIVEDNPRNMKLARDVLGHHGYRTLEAADAEQGLALARAERPSLILMDVQLPGMDGSRRSTRLRARSGDRGASGWSR